MPSSFNFPNMPCSQTNWSLCFYYPATTTITISSTPSATTLTSFTPLLFSAKTLTPWQAIFSLTPSQGSHSFLHLSIYYHWLHLYPSNYLTAFLEFLVGRGPGEGCFCFAFMYTTLESLRQRKTCLCPQSLAQYYKDTFIMCLIRAWHSS